MKNALSGRAIVTEKDALAFDDLIFDVVRGLTPQQATRYGLLLADRIITVCLDICDKTRTECLSMKEGIDLAWSAFLEGKQVPRKAQVFCLQGDGRMQTRLVPSNEDDGLISALIFTSGNCIADFIDAILDGQQQDASYLSRCIMDLFDVIRDEDVVDDERLSALWSNEMAAQLSILEQIELDVELPRAPQSISFLGNILERRTLKNARNKS